MIELQNGFPFVRFPAFAKSGNVVAAVATRKGGVSQAPFDSLNMSFSTGDDPEAVRENRRRFLSLFHIDPSSIISCHQVHGTHVAAMTEADRGRGALDRESAVPECDGLMTNARHVPLTMNFADCTPLLFYDPMNEAIAISHGGWRGTAGDIGEKTVRLMSARYGTRPEHLLVGIGPAIGGCSFEVGDDVIEAFQRLFTPAEMKTLVVKKPNGKYLFDLPRANKKLLLRTGVLESHIDDCGICTYCHDDMFFSYRKSGGTTGRHMAVIMLE